MLKHLTIAIALTLALGVGACSKRPHASGTLPGVTPKVVQTEKITLDNLDRRLSAVEQRNARIDARVAARAAAARRAVPQ
jgi:hypothetical protein